MMRVSSVSQSVSQTEVKLRQSNIELLRIVAMLMIVAHHFAVHSGFDFSNDAITVNRLWTQFIQMGGKIGVNVYVLISGYFLISTVELKLSKAIKLWLQIVAYSLFIFVIFVSTGLKSFEIKGLIKACFPVTFSQWWFASTYFVLYLITPFLNKMLRSLDKKTYQHALLLALLYWCIIPTFTGQSFESNNLLWFVFLYAFAGYIRIHAVTTGISGKKYIFASAAVILMTFCSTVIFDLLGTKIEIFGSHATFFYGMQRLPVFVISVLIFIGFSKLEIGYCRVINIISSATFGVYLIHDNNNVREFLWKRLLPNVAMSDKASYIPYSVFVIAIVFVLCTLIELARIYAIERHYMRFVHVLSEKLSRIIRKINSCRLLDKL